MALLRYSYILLSVSRFIQKNWGNENESSCFVVFSFNLFQRNLGFEADCFWRNFGAEPQAESKQLSFFLFSHLDGQSCVRYWKLNCGL